MSSVQYNSRYMTKQEAFQVTWPTYQFSALQ